MCAADCQAKLLDGSQEAEEEEGPEVPRIAVQMRCLHIPM